MRIRMSIALTIVASIMASIVSPPRSASAQTTSQSWPERSVRFIVPFGPGSASDITARILAERLQKMWGKPVIVENRPGGDGLVSIGAFVSAKDDHTLLHTPSTVFLVHPYMHAKLPYDPETDLQPIASASSVPIGIAVTATLPAKSMKELVSLARERDGKLNYAVGVGFLEFVWNGFLREHSVPMVKVPFRDVVQAPMDLGEGRIDVLMTSVTTHRPMLQSGKTRLLAINDPKRTDLAPGVPSVVEDGFQNLVLVSTNILFGPSHMEINLRQRVAKDVLTVLEDKEVLDRLRGSGQQVVGSGPEGVAKFLAEQHAQVARIAKVLGISRKK